MHSKHAQAPVASSKTPPGAGHTIGDVHRPDLVGTLHTHPARPVRIRPVLRMAACGPELTIQRLDTHAPHRRPHVLPAQIMGVLAHERILQMQPVNRSHEFQIPVAHWPGQVVHTRPADTQRLGPARIFTEPETGMARVRCVQGKARSAPRKAHAASGQRAPPASARGRHG